jgi:ABC-2 type transport system permease protein
VKISLLRVRVMVQKELRQLLRDPKTKRIMFGAPIIQLMLFGYAVNTDVRNVATMVVDQDQTAESRLLTETLTASGYFRIAGHSDRASAIDQALDAGHAVEGMEVDFRSSSPGPAPIPPP